MSTQSPIFTISLVEFQAELMSFLAAGAFVDNTIWVGSSQTATQHILNVASDFFCLNNISINNDKTVAIPINCWVTAPYLTISVSPLNNFLADVVCIFSGCDLSLGGSLAGAFRLQNVPFWFDLSVHFLGGIAFSSGRSPHKNVFGSSDICQSLGFGVICNDLLNVGAACLSVYTDGSLSNLGTVDMLAGAVVFFENIDSGLGVGVSGLVSSTLTKLQIKVKGHLGVLDNKRADVLAKNVTLSVWHLPHLVSERFLKTGVDMVSGNLRHFVHDVFRSIHYTHWEVGCLCADIDWLRFFLVWHLDSHMATDFTNIRMAGFHTYFMKTLHYYLLVAVRKHLYDRGYSSVVCLFCDEVEISDHVFFCSSDANSRTSLLDAYAAA
ncbi:hypothetical protein G9A89_017218 [Geosiphon pyriformis]|nr:hypothetical protein G9A89_017218 [Geosiphon pyriformis]